MSRPTALVTGAARGQGRSHALAFAERGMRVALLDVAAPVSPLQYEPSTAGDLDETARLVEVAGAPVLRVHCDVRDGEQVGAAVDAVLKEFGSIDVAVLNQGIWSTGPFWEITEEQWTATYDVNVHGTWRLMKAMAPALMEQRGGSVVLIGSTSATVPTSGYAHYASSKAALVQLAKIFALELGGYGVRVNSVSPGLVNTPMIHFQDVYDRVRPGASREDFQRAAYATTALAGRGHLDPASVTAAVLWLCSDAARDITGTDLIVDAGNRLLPRRNPNPTIPGEAEEHR
ncbi:SDR family oxidoreductase [Actinomadura madurae]|uniref:SDR family oxidoreductase n=1 Tax=Actinomadura madurae TaxID=1993 RepID=UPI002026A938|nr:SDR family oxidoreductase [Actinomadura madurae]URM97474.1 SDR family oxidoreductase [Actinomadura madurae]